MPPMDRANPVHGSTVNNTITPKKAIVKLTMIKIIYNANSIIF